MLAGDFCSLTRVSSATTPSLLPSSALLSCHLLQGALTAGSEPWPSCEGTDWLGEEAWATREKHILLSPLPPPAPHPAPLGSVWVGDKGRRAADQGTPTPCIPQASRLLAVHPLPLV